MSSIASEPASGAAGVLQVASLVDGRARTDAPGGTLTSTNPAPSEVVATVSLGDASTFVDAARAARAAQKEWAAVPAPARGRVIAQVGRLVEANKEALASLVTREIGKPYPEALGEVQEIVDTCDFFLGEGRRLYGQTVPSEMPNKQLFTFRMPVGVAAIITAGNFPVAVPAWYLVPAILCGNAVVWKPAEYSRRSRRRAGEAVPRGRRARRRPERRPGVGRRHVRGAGAGVGCRPGRQGRLHRLDRRGLADRRAVRAPRPVAVPRARRQEPDGRDGRRRRRSRRRGRAVRRVRHGGPALHVARHGDRARVRVTTSSSPSSRSGCPRRRSAIRSARCSTGR